MTTITIEAANKNMLIELPEFDGPKLRSTTTKTGMTIPAVKSMLIRGAGPGTVTYRTISGDEVTLPFNRFLLTTHTMYDVEVKVTDLTIVVVEPCEYEEATGGGVN